MNLYVGNLDYSVKAIELEQLFALFGEVISVKVIVNTKTKKSKGYAFVELDIDSKTYQRMLDDISQKSYRGRFLNINQHH